MLNGVIGRFHHLPQQHIHTHTHTLTKDGCAHSIAFTPLSRPSRGVAMHTWHPISDRSHRWCQRICSNHRDVLCCVRSDYVMIVVSETFTRTPSGPVMEETDNFPNSGVGKSSTISRRFAPYRQTVVFRIVIETRGIMANMGDLDG